MKPWWVNVKCDKLPPSKQLDNENLTGSLSTKLYLIQPNVAHIRKHEIQIILCNILAMYVA